MLDTYVFWRSARTTDLSISVQNDVWLDYSLCPSIGFARLLSQKVRLCDYEFESLLFLSAHRYRTTVHYTSLSNLSFFRDPASTICPERDACLRCSQTIGKFMRLATKMTFGELSFAFITRLRRISTMVSGVLPRTVRTPR